LSFFLCTAKVVTDRTSGYSKGFGFVRYGTLEDAAEGIKGMDGQVSFTRLPLFSWCEDCGWIRVMTSNCLGDAAYSVDRS